MKMNLQLLALVAMVWLPPAPAQGAEPWTLERAIAFALTNSPDAAVARQRIVAAQAGLEQANAAFHPQVQFSSTYLRTDNPAAIFGHVLNQKSFTPGLNFNDPPDIDNLNVKGAVTVPLYNGGRNVAGREAARANVAATREQAEAVRDALAFEVARTFYTVGKAREFIRAAESSVRAFEANTQIATRRFNAGTMLKAELLDVEVRLAQAREDLVRARNACALVERALRNLLGIESGEFAVADDVPEVNTPAADVAALRPELVAARQRIAATEAEVRRARGWQRPRVNAFGSYEHDNGWEYNGSGASWTAGVMLQFDIWDGRLNRAKVNAARAEAESVREEERKLRLTVDFEVEQARLHLQEADGRLAVTGKATAQAEESRELTRARFEQGLALATQLIDTETALTGARVRRAEAEADRRIAVAALRKALGLPQMESLKDQNFKLPEKHQATNERSN
ncbi:MAG: TolC family protein [Verrucomicrobiota bacterium]